MAHWWEQAFFYHIYPLGFCGAPQSNSFEGEPVDRLHLIERALPAVEAAGCNAIYLGPALESSSHGYDTADYYWVDRRLGDEAALQSLVGSIHERGMRVILDGVFHHVGRDFWAFQKLKEEGEGSPYVSWFRGVDFSADNRFGDGFVYHAWEGNEDLVALDLTNDEVVDHLLGAVEWMIQGLGIDGLRLDVAYLLEPSFMERLRSFTDRVGEDFWLMGETIHGDYTELVRPNRLHSVTNYECYKGLWSSHNDGNYFEIAHSLERQFAPGGIYEGMLLYNFADNHDVDRVASVLDEPAHLFSLYALLMTMPGIPSVYYGSEYGIRGRKQNGDDRGLRPRWEDIDRSNDELADYLLQLQRIRQASPALRVGAYRGLHVEHETFVFERSVEGEVVIVGVNARGEQTEIELNEPAFGDGKLVSVYDASRSVEARNGTATLPIPAYGYEVVRLEV
ncbi:MAG: alpha-amylase family glycosyl hydrolase [Spirochaetota bacterium]